MLCRKTVDALAVAWSLRIQKKRPRVEQWWTTVARVRRGVWDSWERAEQLAPPSCKPPPGRPPHSCSAPASPRHATPHDRPASTVHCLPRPRTLSLIYSTLLCYSSLTRHRPREALWDGRGVKSRKVEYSRCSIAVPKTTALEIHEYLLGRNRKNI